MESKEKIAGLAGTAIFHILLIVFLLFYYIKPSFGYRMSEELEGVPVMFGNVPDAFGDNEPFGRGNNAPVETPNQEEVTDSSIPQPNSTPTPPVQSQDERPIATQDFEETIAINEQKKKEEEERKRQEAIVAEERRKEEEARRIAAQEAEKKANINNQMAGLFGNGSGDGSRGETEGTGTQGVPTGNASHGKTSGIGGNGTYDLGGRGVGSGGLILPAYTANDYGTVVIDIIVDPRGNVLEATIGRGTNTPSSKLKEEALKAARQTKFSAANTAVNQKGTITYKFNLN